MSQTLISRQPDERRTAYVAIPDDDHECMASECDLTADLAITFQGSVGTPHYICVRDWPKTRALLTDTGYFLDYSDDALTVILASVHPHGIPSDRPHE